MSQLILVSNRLPVSIRRSDGHVTLVPSSGGLVRGLSPLQESSDCLWIGNLGVRADTVDASLDRQLSERRFVDVEVPVEMGRRYYNGFSNGVLWPILHHFIESFEYAPADFRAYRAVNERFAEEIARQARPDATIWVHDYHLLLLPAMLRERVPEAKIGFFLHTPFPPAEIFESIPNASLLLRGLVGADLLGVHTGDYAHHLLRALRRELGEDVDERNMRAGRARIEVHPIGIDVEAFRTQAASEAVESRLQRWRRRMDGRKVLLGVDRLDYTKGLPFRFDAFRQLLDTHRRWASDAVFIQVAVPTRTAVRKYKLLKEEVERRVGEINGKYHGTGIPLWYLYRSVPSDELSALYRLADVLVVTPLRDGMNLVAKEYVASRLDGTGVLVLSRFAGAASELEGALLVNPWDVEGSAATLADALELGEREQRKRMAINRRAVEEGDALSWGRRFVDSLRAAEPPSSEGVAGTVHPGLRAFS